MKLIRSKTKNLWDRLNKNVFQFPGTKEGFTLMDYLSGILIFGGPRSGKTSFVLRFLLKGWFKMNLPAFISSTRVNDAETIAGWAKENGREDETILFDSISGLKFNLIEYVMKTLGADSNTLVDIILQIHGIISNMESRGGKGKEEPYWRDQARNLLAMTIELRQLSKKPLTWTAIRKIVIGGFSEDDLNRYHQIWRKLKTEDEDSPEWNRTYDEYMNWRKHNWFLDSFDEASLRDDLTEEEEKQFEMLEEFWMLEIPRFSEKTLSIIRSMIHSVTRPFEVKGILKDHFSSGLSHELLPENVLAKSKIVICGFNPKEHKKAGLIATSILKLVYESYWESRDLKKEGANAKACLICVDEFQLYLDPVEDAIASSTRGGSLIAQLFICQSLDALIFACGGPNAEAQAKSLASNQNVKIFCAQSNVNSNTWASQIVGSHFVDTVNTTINLESANSQSFGQLFHPKVPPSYFTTLSTGATGKVETIVFQTGRSWSSNGGQNYGQITFTLKS